MELKNLIGDYDAFITNMFDKLSSCNIILDSTHFTEIDHIAYRVTSIESYTSMKTKLQEFGQLVSEVHIKDRPISIFKLNQPIVHKNYSISAIELPSPSGHRAYVEGLQHIEVVTNMKLSEIINQYPELQFELSQPESINPELSLRFPDGNAVKFHNKSILEVVELQKKAGMK
jgi:uncharacterized protein